MWLAATVQTEKNVENKNTKNTFYEKNYKRLWAFIITVVD